MKRLTRFIAVSGVAASAAAALLIGSTANSQEFDPAKPVATAAGTVDYQNINPAIQMGGAYGNLSATAHGTFGKFPANFITPVHTHTFAYHGVVIGGTMTNPFGAKGEANPTQMASGSYWYVPAGMPHATACVSDEPCQFYFHSDGGFDFTEHTE